MNHPIKQLSVRHHWNPEGESWYWYLGTDSGFRTQALADSLHSDLIAWFNQLPFGIDWELNLDVPCMDITGDLGLTKYIEHRRSISYVDPRLHPVVLINTALHEYGHALRWGLSGPRKTEDELDHDDDWRGYTTMLFERAAMPNHNGLT